MKDSIEERLKRKLAATSHQLKMLYKEVEAVYIQCNKAEDQVRILNKAIKRKNEQIKNLCSNLTDSHYEIRTLSKAMMKKDGEIKNLTEKLSLGV